MRTPKISKGILLKIFWSVSFVIFFISVASFIGSWKSAFASDISCNCTITASPSSGPAPLTVSFTPSYVNNGTQDDGCLTDNNFQGDGTFPTTYAWRFSGGDIANTPQASHTYTTPGTGRASLTIKLSKYVGLDNFTVTYTCATAVTVTASQTPPSGCNPPCTNGQVCVGGSCVSESGGGDGGSGGGGGGSGGGDGGSGGGGGGYSPDAVVPNPTGLTSFTDLLGKIISYLLEIVGPLVVIMALWGGFQILTAAGDEGKFKEGKKTLTYAVIGAIVIICASGLIYIINEFLGVTTK